MKLIKTLLKRLPFFGSLNRWRQRTFLSADKRSAIFSRIYHTNYWGNSESLSGQGSTLEETEEVRKRLGELFRRLGIVKMVDAPCGDFNWMSKMDLSGIDYTGADIVEEIVRENNARHAQNGRRFIKADIVSEVLPPSDLILCRDCLVHLSYSDIRKSIRNFRKSGARYLLTTSFINKKTNHDIITGNWRPLNLEISPFGDFTIIDRIAEENKTDEGKYLLLISLNTH